MAVTALMSVVSSTFATKCLLHMVAQDTQLQCALTGDGKGRTEVAIIRLTLLLPLILYTRAAEPAASFITSKFRIARSLYHFFCAKDSRELTLFRNLPSLGLCHCKPLNAELGTRDKESLKGSVKPSLRVLAEQRRTDQ